MMELYTNLVPLFLVSVLGDKRGAGILQTCAARLLCRHSCYVPCRISTKVGHEHNYYKYTPFANAVRTDLTSNLYDNSLGYPDSVR